MLRHNLFAACEAQSVSWLRIKSLHSFFRVTCVSENAQNIACEDSGFGLGCGCESAQKVGCEGSGEGRSIVPKTPRKLWTRRSEGRSQRPSANKSSERTVKSR